MIERSSTIEIAGATAAESPSVIDKQQRQPIVKQQQPIEKQLTVEHQQQSIEEQQQQPIVKQQQQPIVEHHRTIARGPYRLPPRGFVVPEPHTALLEPEGWEKKAAKFLASGHHQQVVVLQRRSIWKRCPIIERKRLKEAHALAIDSIFVTPRHIAGLEQRQPRTIQFMEDAMAEEPLDHPEGCKCGGCRNREVGDLSLQHAALQEVHAKLAADAEEKRKVEQKKIEIDETAEDAAVEMEQNADGSFVEPQATENQDQDMNENEHEYENVDASQTIDAEYEHENVPEIQITVVEHHGQPEHLLPEHPEQHRREEVAEGLREGLRDCHREDASECACVGACTARGGVRVRDRADLRERDAQRECEPERQ